MSSVFIVTGASRGLGQAIAKLLIDNSDNSKVVLVARSKSRLEKFIDLFPETHRPDVAQRTLIVAGDLTDRSVVKSIIDQTIGKFGRIDGIIFNAGKLDPVNHIAKIDVDEMKKLFDINLFSIVELLKQAIPYLRKAGTAEKPASCLFVSSGASTKPYDGWLSYGASKAAVNHVALDLSVEEAPKIHSISIAPGVVNTEMQTHIRNEIGSHMKPQALKRFTDLYNNNQLLPPKVPGSVYANMALRGIPEALNGKYVRYSDDCLASYIEQN